MSAQRNENEKHEEKKSLILDASFGIKKTKDAKERTPVNFKLDFSSLSSEEIAKWAAKAVTQEINGEVRVNLEDSSKGRKLEDVEGKVIVVEALKKGGRGQVSEEKALEVIAKNAGISVDKVKEMLATLKGAAK